MEYLILDTETTGTDPNRDEVVSAAIITSTGRVLLDTLVQPVKHTSWPRAEAIHKISPAEVFRLGVPTLRSLNPIIAAIVGGRQVVIYNAQYDATILRQAFTLHPPAAVHCAMLPFSQHFGAWNDYRKDWRWQKLAIAANHVGHRWRGEAHGALADCWAALDVWEYLKRLSLI